MFLFFFSAHFSVFSLFYFSLLSFTLVLFRLSKFSIFWPLLSLILRKEYNGEHTNECNLYYFEYKKKYILSIITSSYQCFEIILTDSLCVFPPIGNARKIIYIYSCRGREKEYIEIYPKLSHGSLYVKYFEINGFLLCVRFLRFFNYLFIIIIIMSPYFDSDMILVGDDGHILA